LSYSPDGGTLALGYSDGRVTWHEAKTGNEVHNVQLPGGRCTGLGWGPDGRLLAASSTKLTAWNAATGAALQAAPLSSTACATTFAPNGAIAAWGGAKWHGDVFDLEKQCSLVSKFPAPGEGTTALAFSSDNRWLAVSGRNPDPDAIDLFQIDNEVKRRLRIVPKQGIVRAVCFALEDRSLLSLGDGNLVRSWDTANGQLQVEMRSALPTLSGLAVSSGGYLLAIASFDSDRGSILQIIDLRTNAESQRFEAPGRMASLGFNHNQERIASGFTDGTTLVWKLKKH
jgi:WD40 repeat protein